MIGSRIFRRLYSNRNVTRLKERGAISDVFPSSSLGEMGRVLTASPQCVYAGFDPTADSLHVGNLLVVTHLLHWRRAGHRVIALLGGATGSVGDPSGRNSERKKLDKKVISENLRAIKTNLRSIFENHDEYFLDSASRPPEPVLILDNRAWYGEMNAVDFVGDLGRNFRMGTMLLKQSVQKRIDSESGMSFAEFAYQIFQAYDWLYLNREYGCRFQVGGSDQMGNILAGHDLISRFSDEQVYGVTLPLVTDEEGDKFGKSAGNAVWLDSAKTTPFSFYQFFVRTKDSEVEKLLNLFTFLKDGEIRDVMARHRGAPEKFTAQKKLAECVTTLVHGKDGLERAIKTTEILYSKNIQSLLRLSESEVFRVFENAPSHRLTLRPGLSVLDLAMEVKCFPTIDDAVRIIKAGGFSINYQKAVNCDEILTESAHIMPNKISLLRVGKKNYYIVKWI